MSITLPARTRRIAVVPALAAVAVLAATPLAHSSTATADPSAAAGTSAAAASSGNVLHRWAATMGGSQRLNAAQALADARNFDVIAGHPRTFKPYLKAMKSANPRLKMIVYLNGTYAQSSQGNAYPASWYAYDAHRNKIRERQFGNWLMDVSNPGWINDRVARCRSERTANHWDGCYIDLLGGAPLGRGYGSGLPVNPRTHKVWTISDWLSATSALGTKVVSGNSNVLIIGNGLNNGPYYYSSSQGPSSKLLHSRLAGANAQGWMRGTSDPVTKFPSVSVWKQNVDMLVNAATLGKSVYTMTKVWHTRATAAQKAAWHRFVLASFLLGTDGHQYFYWSDTGEESAVGQDTSYDHVNVGSPAGKYRSAGAAFIRSFSAGVAVVNPSASPVRMALGGTFRDLQGHQTNVVTMAPHSGDVFSR